MSKIIVVANQKGGVGKSTTVVHFAFHFASKGKVCLIDTDSQGNSSSTMKEAGYEVLTVGASDLYHDDQIQISEPKGNIGIIAADKMLSDVESYDLESIINPSIHLKKMEWADYIFIDTPPSLGRRLLGALVAADHVLCPIELTGYAMDGLKDLLATIEMVKDQFNPDLNFIGVLANKVHSTSKSQKNFMGMLIESFGETIIPQVIGNRVSVSDAVSKGKPVWGVNSKGGRTAGKEFKDAFVQIEERMKLVTRGNKDD
ncbi:MAG: ParA family protein [Sedimenticola sp.]